MEIEVCPDFRNVCPDFRGVAVIATVRNSRHNTDLWMEIDEYIHICRANNELEDIKKHPVIRATREAYKKLGKDPNRYRPSAEALCRRILRGLPLYQINTLVDLINLVSIQMGYSIGGFDAAKIEGEKLVLDVGRNGEPFDAIGRGMLNIEGLPVYRDSIGGIGTPTSDNERSKIELETTQFLGIINGYNGEEGLTNTAETLAKLLEKYVFAENTEIYYF